MCLLSNETFKIRLRNKTVIRNFLITYIEDIAIEFTTDKLIDDYTILTHGALLR
jgi:hypothetical protein